ncbi:MAG: tetratricopeptide repeat protein [Anaerolineae bacterium]|nr:tetratricopeptide repeat protein [Anaerolineae bacterium]
MRKIGFIVTLLLALWITFPALAQQNATGQTAQAVGPLPVMPELFDRANSASAAGNHSQAIVDYSLFILLNPTFSQGYASRALSYDALGDTDQAIGDLTRALSYDIPQVQYKAAVYYTRATLYLKQNDLTDALDDLNVSIDAYPDGVDSLGLRAQLLTYTNRYPDALTDLNHLIELQPSEARHYLDRGFIHTQLGQSDEALADYDRAVDLNPQDARPYAERALYYSAQRQFSDALVDINNAISRSPQNGEFYLVRGSIHAVVDKPIEAADDYFQWMSLNLTKRYIAPQTLTSSQAFTVEMQPGWVYNIPFAASAGQKVNIAASGESPQSPVDPLLVILGTNGSPLISDDDSGGNMAAFIRNYEIPEDGEYTLVVGQAGGGAPQGNVNVQVDLGASG